MTNLAASDWGESPRIHVDIASGPPSRERVAAAYGEMLRVAAEIPADYTLLLEDDIEVNRHLRHNLLHWNPLREAKLILGSLYNPDVAHLPGYRPDAEADEQPSFVAEIRSVLGAQAVILSRAFLNYAVVHWYDAGAGQNRRLVRLASGFGPMQYHTPSLVQHIAIESLYGSELATARDFDPDWRWKESSNGML
ncbi:MAG TPA: hypothetical protein VFV83_11215 [Chthoniobacteraceae bacterium]|nr:hypothetical protein [Chthoniobacteraceae bacterium]